MWLKTANEILFYVALVSCLMSAIRIAGKQKRFVLFRTGRAIAVRGPGIVFLLPWRNALGIDLREKHLQLDAQSYKTQDNRDVRLAGTLSWRIVDPIKSVELLQTTFVTVENFVTKWLGLALCGIPSPNIASKTGDLEDKLTSSLRKEFAEWGTELISCRVADIQTAHDGVHAAVAQG